MSTNLLSRTQAEVERLVQRPSELHILTESVVRTLAETSRTSKEEGAKSGRGTVVSLGESTATSLGPAEEAIPTGKTKVCTKCKLPKPVGRFPKHPDTADGLAAWCKDCRAVLRKRRNQTNMVARLKHHFAARITQQLTDAGIQDIPPLVAEMESYLGYKMSDLVRYLEEDIQERENMSLKIAFGKGYHVDHIVPLSAFPLVKIGDESFQACWAIDNLRAIPAADNLKKGSKVIREDSK